MKLGNLRGIPALAVVAACSLFSANAVAADETNAAKVDEFRTLVDTCMGCHGIPGYRASFPQVYRVPKIAGQHAEYIASALRAYASGERSHPTMDALARSLTDEDITNLANFYSNLK